MKKIITLTLAVIIAKVGFAQDYLGLSTGNYAGVTGVILQPASIVDSRHKFDINLFSTSLNVSNNYLLIDREALTKFNPKNFKNFDTFKGNYLSKANIGTDKAWFNVNNRVQLPLSFMVSLGQKNALALNLQNRTMIQGRNISSQFAELAYDGFYRPTNGQMIDNSGYSFNAMNWVEAGLTYGTVLFNTDKHFLKAAVTGKYLGGINSFNLGSDNFKVGVNADSSFNISTSNHLYNHNNGADFDMVFDRSWRPDGNSWGFDAGLVYEFRGSIEKFRYISRDDQKSEVADRRDKNKYMFKLGVSLLDFGKIDFEKPNMARNFDANIVGWNIKNANYSSLKEFDTALAARSVRNASDKRQYSMHMPTALNVQFDLRLVRGFYINAMAHRPLNLGSDDGYRWDNAGFYAITPRWESRHIGIYLPYSFSDYKNITGYKNNVLGATLRLGPVFVGSSNLGTALFKDQLQNADVHVGLKLGITHGKPSKSGRLLENITNTVSEPVRTGLNEENNVYGDGRRDTTIKVVVEERRTDRISRPNERTTIDYKNGRIQTTGDDKGNIIIINNYYYGNDGKDSLIRREERMERRFMRTDNDVVRDTLILKQRLTNDTLEVKRNQLDSLINEMQQYRKTADSLQTVKADSAANAYQYKIDSLETAYTRAVAENNSATANRLKEEQERLKASYSKEIAEAKKKSNTVSDYDQRLLENYMWESNRLRNEMNDLQNRLRETNRQLANRQPVYVNANPAPINYGAPVYQAQPQTVYLRDTVYINRTEPGQTILVRDTVVKTETQVQREVVKEKVNYANVPAEVVLFDVGKADIKQVYFKRLNFIADLLIKDPNAIAVITGHTDKTGSLAINEALSIKRADAVKTYLKRRNVNESQMQSFAAASADPVMDGSSKSALSQNRRVTIKLVDDK